MTLDLVLPVLLVLLHAMVLLELESLVRGSGTEGLGDPQSLDQ